MAKQAKPTFLKTFSEFTVAELRSMPLHRVLSLFGQEVTSTFTERKPDSTPKKKIKTKKKSLSLEQKKTAFFKGFTEAMKRVFTIHRTVSTASEEAVVTAPIKADAKPVKLKKEKAKENKEETVVFSSQNAPEDVPMPPMV